MANVIFSTFSNLPDGVLDSFRQGFVDALVREGNSVLLFVTNQFLVNHNSSNDLRASIDKHRLILAIKEFNPDLFISVNHSGLFPALSDSIDCPIAIWLLDGPGYLIDPEHCRAKASRYQFYIATRTFRNDLNQSFAIPNSNIHDLPLASDFQAQTKETIYDIAFVGTNFTGQKFQEIVKKLGKNRHLIGKLRALIASYKSDSDMQFEARTKKYGFENIFTGGFDEAYILNTISINKRIKVLDAIEDLGLILYGTADWTETIKYSLGLALSFDPSPVLTRTDLESIYNTSKISLNISHSQARGGLPWRVFDVMSCNSVLISDFQEDFTRLFGKDIPIPIYESPSEAREVCNHLLKDESHRRFIVESCNKIIESGHKFKHRLKTISQIFNLNLLPTGTGELTRLNADNYKNKEQPFSRLNKVIPKMIDDTNKKFSLQLFQSNLIDFVADNSKLVSINIPEDKQLCCEFRLSKSMPFLRLDIGEYFSKHKNVRITVSLDSQLSKNGPRSRIIDLSKDIIHSNEMHWKNSELYCGFDSFCIFENPFPSQDIKLNFESFLITGL